MSLIAPGVYVIDDMLTQQDCKKYRRLIDIKRAKAKIGDVPKFNMFYQENDVMIELWNKIKDRLPAELGVYNDAPLYGLGEQWTAVYYNGGLINPHIDKPYQYNGKQAVYSVLFYLNDNYYGGETVIQLDKPITVKPKLGRCLIFHMDYLHECNRVNGTKYCLGAKLCY